jgi:hypothetical protein
MIEVILLTGLTLFLACGLSELIGTVGAVSSHNAHRALPTMMQSGTFY